jgi:hypothetical protein
VGLTIGVLLTLAAVTVIAWPFVRRRGAVPGGPSSRGFELRRARGDIYRQVRQLEVDHSAGLVGKAEFRSQMDELRVTAARLLREEAALQEGDAGQPLADPMARLEQEIADARAVLAPAQERSPK